MKIKHQVFEKVEQYRAPGTLITSNTWLLKSAIHQLENDRFYQVGRESVAIAEIQDAPEIIYTDENIQSALEELITEGLEDEEPIH